MTVSRPVTLAVFRVLFSVSSALAQAPDSDRPVFDVVSVKANRSQDAAMQFDLQAGGRLVVVNIPLRQFIRAAYTLQTYQIDAPSWTDAERFDITALTTRELAGPIVWTPGQFAPLQLMMQAVLADRFGMAAHMEDRESQGYALVVRTPPDVSGGLLPAAEACGTTCGMKIAAGSVRARRVPLRQFAELLSQLTGRLVIDATGLNGSFDFDMEWRPEPDTASGGSDKPSLFTAVQEQLGLRLEPRRLPVPTLVVDSIERPSPD